MDESDVEDGTTSVTKSTTTRRVALGRFLTYATTTVATVAASSSSSNALESTAMPAPAAAAAPSSGATIVAAAGGRETYWPLGKVAFSLLPLSGTYTRRATVIEEVAGGSIWTCDQIQGVVNVNVPVRMVVVKVRPSYGRRPRPVRG